MGKVNLDFEATMFKVKSLLGTYKGKVPDPYPDPPRTLIFYSFLGAYNKSLPVGHIFTNCQFNVVPYLPIVVHGHSSHEVCATPHYCHESTYRPIEGDSPVFKQLFYKKWSQYANET